MRLRRELGRTGVTVLAVAFLALLVHEWNGDLSNGSLAGRATALLGIALLVQHLHLLIERSRRRTAAHLVPLWVTYAVAFGGATYLLPLDDVSFPRAMLSGVLFATVMTPFAGWDVHRAKRRKQDEADVEDARLDREHERRLAQAEQTWLPR